MSSAKDGLIEQNKSSDSCGEIPIDTNEKLSLLIESVARNASLPRTYNVENGPLDAKHIASYSKNVEKSLTILDVILVKFSRKRIKAIKELDPIEKCAIHNLLYLCGEHQYVKLKWNNGGTSLDLPTWVTEMNNYVMKSALWITEETHRLSSRILIKLETMAQKTVKELIALYGEVCLKKLTKQGASPAKWTQHVGTTHCYLWILINVDASYLFPLLKELKSMDLLLSLLEHHSSEYKIVALQIMLCLMFKLNDKHVSLLFDSEKLLKQLKNTLYHSDQVLILPATTCIIKYLNARRNLRPHKNDAMLVDYEWSIIDELRDILIPFVETSQDAQVQATYIDAFSVMISFTRVCTVRWHYPIMQIIEKSIAKPSVYESVLNMFQTYLLNTWPYIRDFSEQYCSYLFKILMEVETNEQQEEVYRCFYVIKQQSDAKLETFLREVRAQVKNKKITKLIDNKFDGNKYDDIDYANYFPFDEEDTNNVGITGQLL